jgi:hypothetical protein
MSLRGGRFPDEAASDGVGIASGKNKIALATIKRNSNRAAFAGGSIAIITAVD